MRSEENKQLVRHLVDEGVNRRNPDALDEVAEGDVPPRAVISTIAKLHEGSHEACDEALEG
jgi:hypothetical protein